MTFDHTAMRTAVFLIAMAASLPAAAQPAPARTASAPSAWSVWSDEARGSVEIAATAKEGVARFVLRCGKSSEPGLAGVFTGYSGTGLRADGEVEHVALYARGEEWRDAFSVRLRYSAATRSWEFVSPLSPIFLSSFSRGATLAVVNSRNQELFVFDLTGSTAATRTMRTICGFAE